jgi:hypothetical protein
MTKKSSYADAFVDAYITAALWSSTDNSTPSGGEPLDANYSSDDLVPETRLKMVSDCLDFLVTAYKIPGFEDLDLSQCGHDFWLTRNGHGTGFWDRDLGRIGEVLTKLSHRYGECNLWVEAGKVYIL